jgi:hypothetical protein
MIRKTEAASKLGAKNQESFAFRRESFNRGHIFIISFGMPMIM